MARGGFVRGLNPCTAANASAFCSNEVLQGLSMYNFSKFSTNATVRSEFQNPLFALLLDCPCSQQTACHATVVIASGIFVVCVGPNVLCFAIRDVHASLAVVLLMFQRPNAQALYSWLFGDLQTRHPAGCIIEVCVRG
jgi:hypothetical protein